MVRIREALRKGLPVAFGVVVGALLVAGLSARPAGAISPQDQQVSMQIQQAINGMQLQLQNQFDTMQAEINRIDGQVREVRFQLDTGTVAGNRLSTPTPDDPIPGMTTWGRLVSESAESQSFVAKGPDGGTYAHMGMTTDGPGFLLFDTTGQISAALLATPSGPELRMLDEEGVLQTVFPQR